MEERGNIKYLYNEETIVLMEELLRFHIGDDLRSEIEVVVKEYRKENKPKREAIF
jgi:hypothetical protein